jgi:hypothetical protein
MSSVSETMRIQGELIRDQSDNLEVLNEFFKPSRKRITSE